VRIFKDLLYLGKISLYGYLFINITLFTLEIITPVGKMGCSTDEYKTPQVYIFFGFLLGHKLSCLTRHDL